MPEHINEVIRRMREKAAENPDYVYSAPEAMFGCVYFEDGDVNCPSCLVGHGIAPIVTPSMFGTDKFGRVGFLDEFKGADHVIGRLATRGVLEYDTDAQVGWVSRVQAEQDRGARWAQAIVTADEEFPLAATNG